MVARTSLPVLLLLLVGCPTLPAGDGGTPGDAAGDAGTGADAASSPEDGGAWDAASWDAGVWDAGASDAGAADAGPTEDGGSSLPDWPPIFISAFGLSYDGPVSDGTDVWVELTVANPQALLGGWRYTSANHSYVNVQLESATLPFVPVAGDIVRVHGATYEGVTDVAKSENNPAVWDVVSTERFGPSFKHGLLWLEAADGQVLDAVVYETGRNQLDWLDAAALAAADTAVAQGEWPSTGEADAVFVEDSDRQWARLRSGLAGDAASDWQIVGADLSTYYEDAVGKTGEALKAALNAIIKDHVVIPYRDVSGILYATDPAPNTAGSVLQFYTGRVTGADFNKEHVWAKSHGGFGSDAYAGYSDLHNLRPTRPDVNSTRWHLDFAEGGAPYSDSGCNLVEDYSFEPPDAVKGDVARTLFYMVVRYEGDDAPMPDLELVEEIPSLLNVQGLPDNNQHMSTPRHGRRSDLLRWHVQDPPDDRERHRNDIIFKDYQRNRNPFVDHPDWAHEIWGY